MKKAILAALSLTALVILGSCAGKERKTDSAVPEINIQLTARSEERRGGKKCSSRG